MECVTSSAVACHWQCHEGPGPPAGFSLPLSGSASGNCRLSHSLCGIAGALALALCVGLASRAYKPEPGDCILLVTPGHGRARALAAAEITIKAARAALLFLIVLQTDVVVTGRDGESG